MAPFYPKSDATTYGHSPMLLRDYLSRPPERSQAGENTKSHIFGQGEGPIRRCRRATAGADGRGRPSWRSRGLGQAHRPGMGGAGGSQTLTASELTYRGGARGGQASLAGSGDYRSPQLRRRELARGRPVPQRRHQQRPPWRHVFGGRAQASRSATASDFLSGLLSGCYRSCG